MSTNSSSPDRCLNCGEPLRGPFCHHCGQRAKDFNRPLWQLLRELFATVLAFDTRLFRTLRPLIFRPGFLTVEYNAGRRVRYVPPLTLYVFVSFVMFVALALVDYSAVQVEDRSPPQTVPQAVEEAPRDDSADEESSDDDDPEPFIARFSETYAEDPEGFDAAFRGHLARSLFLMVPFFALLLKGVYLTRGRLYFQHLILSLHYHAFAFLVLTAEAVVDSLVVWLAKPTDLVVGLAFVVYLFVALRRVYGGGRLWTGIKLLVLLVFYLAILGVVMLGTLAITVLFS